MTREPADSPPRSSGSTVEKSRSANDFYREIGSAVNGPGGYFGRNLDALADCLRGGFGTPDDRPFGSNGSTARCRGTPLLRYAMGGAHYSRRYRTSSTTPAYP